MNKNLLKKIEQHPRESVEQRMILNVPTCRPLEIIADIKKEIFNQVTKFETLNYIYVLSDQDKLVGVFSIKELLASNENIKAEEIMNKEVIKVMSGVDQEKAAVLAIKHNIKAIPVTDENGQFLGVITSDSILDILHQEHVEDLLLSVGIYKKDDFSKKIIRASVWLMAKMRLPWLIIGLFGGVLAAQIIVFFEESLSTNFVLAAFIPLIVYMAAAAASQTQTLYVRNLAMNYFSQKKYFFKEIKTGILLGAVLAVILFIVSFLFANDLFVAVILSVSVFLTTLAAIILAFFITWILSKTGKDPALGSGPFGTIAADIFSLIIYFIVISLFFVIWG